MQPRPAPEWHTTTWFNTPAPISLPELRGRIVVVHAFQMLCPGCVTHGIPQAQRVAQTFREEPLSVIGLHAVFEHHAAMAPECLRAFLHEFRVQFPVGVDEPGADGDPLPRTMRAYAMRGTPTTLVIDAQGRLRHQVFGAYDPLRLGADIGALLREADGEVSAAVAPEADGIDSCSPAGCPVG
jgi:peroxiredoxin